MQFTSSGELHTIHDTSSFCNNVVIIEITQLIIIIEVEAVTNGESSTNNRALIVTSRLYLDYELSCCVIRGWSSNKVRIDDDWETRSEFSQVCGWIKT